MGESHISTQILRARTAVDTRSAWVAAVAIPLMLLAPALWNGYPLLQWDTGGYLARWYEGYLVPSRSTTFGLYLHFGEDSSFWINLGISALATLWILQLTLRVLGQPQPLRLLAISLVLVLTTSLPWLASTLLTDIFAGLSVLALFILVAHRARTSIPEKCLLFGLTAFAAATHSATLAVLLGLCCIGWIARPFLRGRVSVSGLTQGSLTIVAGAALLLSTNFVLSGKLTWTPGGYGVAFGRMLQDGIVAQYLRDHCPKQSFKLCPYRDRLPATADQFLWGNSMFNTLGRFQGLSDEMGFIVLHSLAEYPAWQAGGADGNCAAAGAGRYRRRHRCLARPYLRHLRALSSRTNKADARGAAAALAFRFHRNQPDSRSGRAGIDAVGSDPVRPRRAASAVRRSHFARRHGHVSRAR